MNKIFSLRRVLAIIAVLVAAWLLFPLVCGKKTGQSPEEVSVRTDAAPSTMNILMARGHSPSTNVGRQIIQTLGELDPITLELSPLLVTSIPKVQVIKDGPRKGQFAYDFELIPEAVWDNGTPLTANDVVFSLKLIFHPGLPADYRGFLPDLNAVEIDPANPKKFRVYFSQFYMLAIETLCGTPIYPAYNYDPANMLSKIPLSDFLDTTKTAMLEADAGLKAFVEGFTQSKFDNDPNSISGTGPYRLEIMNEQGAVLVKKQNWWGDKVVDKYPLLAAYPKKLVYKVVKDDLTLETMLKNNELDIVGGAITPSLFLDMKANDSLASRYNFITLGHTQFNRMLLNLNNPILSDVQVRRAIRHLIDYDYMVNQVQRGMAVRLTSPMPPDRPYYDKNLPLPDFNIAKAKEMLTQAGWADTDGNGILDKEINGVRQQFTFKLLAATASKTNELFVNSFKEATRQAGIELIVVPADLTVLSADTRSGKYDAAILGASVRPGSVEFYQRLHSKSLAPAGDNRAGYVSAKADQLIEAIRTEPDEVKRTAFYLQLQQVIYDEVPEIPILAPLQRLIISKKFIPGQIESANRPGHYEHFARVKE